MKSGGRDRDRTGDPLLAKRKLGHRHHLLRRATKRDWVNVSAGIRALGMRARPLLSNADSYRGVHQIVHQLLSLRKVSLFAIRDRKAVEQSPQSLALPSLPQVCFRCTGFRLQSVSLDFE